ncbi:MAG: DUF317 domain-containing protein [Streptomycetaceae bacterium]|nr:DUF317 domain-containing protein [Streptomycetaceae bacterium]
MKKKQRRWTGWGPAHQQAEQHYLVEPRHLAGGGDPRHVTEFLRASGWKDRSKKRGPVVFDSPDRSMRITYDPSAGGWAISGKQTPGQLAWQARFGPQVPVEIVAGFTDALTQPRYAHAPHVWAPLQQQGWKRGNGQHVTATSPDASVWVQFRQSGPDQAYWWAGARTEHGRAWDATFTSTTPLHLITAFTATLADPQPVMRPRGCLPPTGRLRTTSVSVLPSQLRAWQQARITAARTAAWALNSQAFTRPRKHPRTTSPYAPPSRTRPRR